MKLGRSHHYFALKLANRIAVFLNRVLGCKKTRQIRHFTLKKMGYKCRISGR